MKRMIDKKIIYFLLLVVATIFVSVFLTQSPASTIYYFVILIMYAKSKDESFWLAFFFVTTDGFFGFFGMYSTLLNILPGLPGIEISQFYILIALSKIWKFRKNNIPFYKNWTVILFAYTIFLFFLGLANGLNGDLNVYFKIAKLILPLALFYTTPRLFKSIDQYANLLKYFFIVFLFAFVAQLFTIATGLSPAANFAIRSEDELEVGRNLRSYYNPYISLVVMCGALFFLAAKQQKFFSKTLLNIMVILCFSMAFLSATRGWIIAFGFIIFSYNVFVNKMQLKNLLLIISLFIIAITISLSFEKVNKQIMFSIERTLTLESLAKGDKTASGTLIRLDERGPPVMEAWEKSPVFGHGFSNVYFLRQDPHVGNLTLLLHSGIVGVCLMAMFFIFVMKSLIQSSLSVYDNPYKKSGLVIVIFLMGWFFIHSTSGQHFGYFGIPGYIFPQAIVLAMANIAIKYRSHKHESSIQ